MMTRYQLREFDAASVAPDTERWLAEHVHEPEILAISKPWRDGLVTRLYVLEQWRRNGDRRIVGVTATRRFSKASDDIVQLPFWERRQANYEECRRVRTIQTAQSVKLSGQRDVESLTALSSAADAKAHRALNFTSAPEIAETQLEDYVEQSQGYPFAPWVRPAGTSLFVRPKPPLTEKLIKLAEVVVPLLNGVEIKQTKSYQIVLPTLK